MLSEDYNKLDKNGRRHGVVLMITLVLLVVLSMIGYTLSVQVLGQRHRNRYIIDYSKARYGCDSAVKYALASLEDIPIELLERPNEPDFSDLFALSEKEYEDFVAQWGREYEKAEIADVNLPVFMLGALSAGSSDADAVFIRGPYGPVWPLVTEPIKVMIGTAVVTIEIEDENAKYPLVWAILDDDKVEREVEAGLEVFCEWMKMDAEQIEVLKEQLEQVKEIKPFKFSLMDVSEAEKKPTKISAKERRKKRIRARRRGTRKKIVVPAATHIADFTKLFHSSLIDTEQLARPIIDSDTRNESALKYIGLWACQKVNINTAPRHVLEAAFVFGGDAEEIAERIIQQRRIEPFKDIKQLRESLLEYSDSITKCEKYITTVSDFFTIRVTSVIGVAKATAVVAVRRSGEKFQKVAVISG